MKKTLIAVFFVALAVYSATGNSRLTGLVQQPSRHKTYLDTDGELEIKAAAAADSGSFWLLIGVRQKGRLSGPQRLELWSTDSKGELLTVAEVSANTTTEDPLDAFNTVLGLTLLKNGTPVLLIGSGNGHLALAVFDRSSKRMVFSRISALAGTGRYFTKFVKAANDDLLVLGRNGSRGLVLRLRPSGEVVSEVLLKDPNSAIVFDLAETAEGYVLAGAQLGDSKQNTCWIAKVTLNGDTISRTTFAGRFVRLACSGRAYVVVCDVLGSRGVNLIASGFSDDLTTSWTTELLTDVEFIRPFDVKALESGEFIVAGAGRTGLLWLARLRRDGSLAWYYEPREESFAAERLWDYRLLLSGETLNLAYSYLVVRDLGGAKYEQRQVVKLTSFSTK